ncbi:hypothetical protein V6N13_071783 [Hibiscus sabdariffa]
MVRNLWSPSPLTLKRIADLFGSFEAFGENFKHLIDCEKVTLLITTNQSNRIQDLEVGNRTYEVNVMEIGFRDDTNDPSIPKNGLHRQNNEEKLRSESRSESSSVKNSASSPVNLDERKSLVDDSINAMSIGNTKAEAVDVSRHVGEDLISGYSKIKCQEGARCNIESNPEEGNGIDVRGACISIEKVEDEKRHEEFNVTRVGPEQNDVPFAPVKEMEHVTPRAVRCMGFKLNSNGLVSETQATKSSWVAAVDARYNAYLNSCIAENPIGVEHCEVALCYCFHWWLIFAAIDRLYNENGPVQFQLCFKRLLRRHIYLDQWDRAVVLCGLQINPSVWVFSIWRC